MGIKVLCKITVLVRKLKKGVPYVRGNVEVIKDITRSEGSTRRPLMSDNVTSIMSILLLRKTCLKNG